MASEQNDHQPVDANGVAVDMVKLITQYSLICPIKKFCDKDTIHKVGFNATGDVLSLVPEDCISCSCDYLCLETGICCPDMEAAFENLECTNVQIWNKETVDMGEKYFLKASCPHKADQETRLKCEDKDGDVSPIYSSVTRFSYRNQFCALCNGLDPTLMSEWPLIVKCLSNAPLHDIVHVGKNCVFIYKPTRFQRGRKCSIPTEVQQPTFDRCNMTGLWALFDQDVDFGCRRFNQRYGKFKNLFCYICNPSHSALKVKGIDKIDQCDSHGFAWHNIALLEELCKTRGTTERLHPFKNVYCLMCNQRYSVLKTKSSSVYIKAITTQPADPTTTMLEITLSDSNSKIKQTLSDIISTVTNPPNDETPYSIPAARTDNRDSGNYFKNITSMIIQYYTVCGLSNICNLSYIPELPQNIPTYRVCPFCDCSDDCITGKFPCCMDKLLVEELYTCSEESSFLRTEPISQDETSRKRTASSHDVSFTTISACPVHSENSLKEKCKGIGESDILQRVPVLQNKSFSAWKNIYCLECRDKLAEDINIYMKFKCIDYFEGILYRSVQEILEAARQQRCSVAFTLNDEKRCFDPDGDELKQAGIIGTCNVSMYWESEDSDIKLACEKTDHAGILNKNVHPYALNNFVYKNPFCAICNKELAYLKDNNFEIPCSDSASDSVKELCRLIPNNSWWAIHRNVYCYFCASNIKEFGTNELHNDSTAVFSVGFARERTMSYRSLFSVSRATFEDVKVETTQKCKDGAYDHQKEKCVNFYCSNGRVIKNGKCVHVFDTTTDRLFSISLTLESADKGKLAENINQTLNMTVTPFEICKTVTESMISRTKVVGEDGLVTKMCTVATGPCVYKRRNGSSDNEALQWVIPVSAFIGVDIVMHKAYTAKRTLLEDTMIDILIEKFVIEGRLFTQNHTAFQDSVERYLNCKLRMNFEKTVPSSTTVLERTTRCLMVEYSLGEDVYTESANIIMKNGTVTIPRTEYQMVVGENIDYIRVCLEALSVSIKNSEINRYFTKIKMSVIDRAYLIFSSCCTALSLLGLLLTFMTYCLFREIRTVPGKNNMHLSMCLFVAQAGLQYSLSLSNQHRSLQCKVTGILIHYFWLATFCAMNVCSFHMYQVFFAKTLHFQSTPTQKSQTALKYACYIYSLPLIIILAVVFIQLVRSNFSDVGYGVEICFIDEFNVLLFSFIAPTGVITIVNIVFYILTFYRLRVLPRLQSTNQDRQELLIYAKLCSITGIMWPLVFVDAYFDLSVFSFLVTFVNAMQGFFMFLSFVCNRRVMKMYKEMVFRQLEVVSRSSAHLSASKGTSTRVTSDQPGTSIFPSGFQDRISKQD